VPLIAIGWNWHILHAIYLPYYYHLSLFSLWYLFGKDIPCPADGDIIKKRKGGIMRRRMAMKLFIPVLLASLWVLSTAGFSTAQKVVSLNYSNFFPAPHKHSLLAEQWCKEIEKRTNGKVKIGYFPGGTLSPAAQIYDGVVKGISDIGFSCFAYTRGKFSSHRGYRPAPRVPERHHPHTDDQRVLREV
jgi:hypothetical protein